VFETGFTVPASLQGGEESAGWTLEGCKMNSIHRTVEKHRGEGGTDELSVITDTKRES
jgi:hypothetical protein